MMRVKRSLSKFPLAYLRSMRPYTFFVTGTAGLAGIMAVRGWTDPARCAVSLILLFSAYGTNQVVNDLLGLKEDSYNKVRRPLVTGELGSRAAWTVTGIIFIAGGIISFFLNPESLIIYVAGYGFNVIYEQMKGIPFAGNLWFGAMIALAPFFGAVTTSGLSLEAALKDKEILMIMLLVMLIQSSLCRLTYFKDEGGDRKAGKMTYVVVMGYRRARYLSFLILPIPHITLLILILMGSFGNGIHIVTLLIAFSSLIMIIIAIKSLRGRGHGEKISLKMTFSGCVMFQNALISLYDPILGLCLAFISYFLIDMIFRLMYRKDFYG